MSGHHHPNRLAQLSPEKKVVVLGLGRTGLSFVRYLHHQGIPCVVNDSRETPPEIAELHAEFPEVELRLGGFDDALMQAADFIFISQGIATQEPAVARALARGQAVVSDMELFAHAAKAPIIAITGSNAKSTVTTLVGHLLAAAGFDVLVGGNLGTPALDLLLAPVPDYYVLEVSNFQLDTSDYFPVALACVLNLSPDHLDRYTCYQDYIAAKHRIYRHAKAIIINRDDELTWPKADLPVVASFGMDEPTPTDFGLLRTVEGVFLAQGHKRLLNVNQLKMRGEHNWQNALAALAIAYHAGAKLEDIVAVLTSFAGLPHRCQWIANVAGVDWYNDSKGTNIGATAAAIRGFTQVVAGQLWILLGGIGKGADFKDLLPAFNHKVAGTIIYGRDAHVIEAALSGHIKTYHAKDFDAALTMASQLARAHDAVLLSPACASFDMFKHYEHRGEVFTQWVEQYAAQHK